MEISLIYVIGSFLTGLVLGFGLGLYYFKKKMESKMEEMMGGMGDLFDPAENEGGMFE